MKSIKIIAILAAFVSIAVLGTTSVKADKECFTQYGGGETCIEDKNPDLKVRKQVKNPKTGDFQDNIEPKKGSNPYIFKSGERIVFRIVVENTGEIKIEDINLEDILPSFVKYASGDGDGKDGNTKVEFDEFDLDPGEEEEFEFTARIGHDGIVPTDKGYVCLTNIAKAKGEVKGEDDKESDVDYSNFCVEFKGKVLGKESPKVLPKTGGATGNEVATALAGSLSLGLVLVGYGIKKIAE